MKVLYLDCFAGIAGDMLVGALCDLGVKPSQIEWELSKLSCANEFHIHARRVERSGIRAVQFSVHVGQHHHACPTHGEGAPPPPSAPEPTEPETVYVHEVAHAHPHAPHRTWADIRTMLQQAGLSERVKARALGVFRRLAEAEAKVHGVPVDRVMFHEVGAVDSIVDIVAACTGIEALGVDAVWSSTPVDGSGFVACAHGNIPVPVPAVLEILKGMPIGVAPENTELITPTGAALLVEFSTRTAGWNGLAVQRVGYGAGTRPLQTRPNLLRAALVQVPSGEVNTPPECVVVLEANLDDDSPELLAEAADRLRKAGALDVSVTPLLMKKGRAGWLLTVLGAEATSDALAEGILRWTSAFGVRETRAVRHLLERELCEVPTPFGAVRVKLGRWRGELLRVAPEFEDCRAAAERAGVSVRAVMEAALAAARSAGWASV